MMKVLEWLLVLELEQESKVLVLVLVSFLILFCIKLIVV